MNSQTYAKNEYVNYLITFKLAQVRPLDSVTSISAVLFAVATAFFAKDKIVALSKLPEILYSPFGSLYLVP